MRINKLDEEKVNEVQRKRNLNELFDFCLYKDCLQEETAEKYFAFLLQTGLQNVDWKSTDKTMNAELNHVNTDLRFNIESRRPYAQNDDYFEGETLEQFEKDFLDFVKEQRRHNLTPKIERKIMTVFNDYVKHFKGDKSVESDYRKIVYWNGHERH